MHCFSFQRYRTITHTHKYTFVLHTSSHTHTCITRISITGVDWEKRNCKWKWQIEAALVLTVIAELTHSANTQPRNSIYSTESMSGENESGTSHYVIVWNFSRKCTQMDTLGFRHFGFCPVPTVRRTCSFVAPNAATLSEWRKQCQWSGISFIIWNVLYMVQKPAWRSLSPQK